jgi:hypothetical protein
MNQIAIVCHPLDITLARQLASDLQKVGAAAWIRLDHVPVGSSWQDEVTQAIRKADLMLLILSPDSMRDELVSQEWEHFLEAGKPLIPLYWRECEPNYKLSRLQYVDFRPEALEYSRAFNHLLHQLSDDHYATIKLKRPRSTQLPTHRLVADIIKEQSGFYPLYRPPAAKRSPHRPQWPILALSAIILALAILVSLFILLSDHLPF